MKRFYKIIIIILLFLNTIGIYFIQNDYDMFGLIDYEDFISLFNFITFGILAITTNKLKTNHSIYKKWIFFFIVLCFLSSLQSLLLFDQSFIDGLLAQKELISVSLLYFPLSKIINNDIISKKELYSIIDKYAILQLGLFITQYVLSDKVSFLVVHTAERYSEIRYYFDPILLDLFLIRNLNNFINTKIKKEKIFNIIWIGLILLDTMVVQKYRLTSIALIIIIVLGMLLGKTKTINKFWHILLSGIFSLFMINTKIIQDLISEFTVNTKTYTYSIREVGRKLYMNMVAKHPILGGGYPKNSTALQAAGSYNRIVFSDNGIFGFAYIYGGLGIIWYITLWIKLLFNGFKIMTKNNNLIYLLFPLFFMITCINELHWYWHHGLIVFVLFLVLFEKEYSEINN